MVREILSESSGSPASNPTPTPTPESLRVTGTGRGWCCCSQGPACLPCSCGPRCCCKLGVACTDLLCVGLGILHVERAQGRAPRCYFSDFSLLASAFSGPLPRGIRAECEGRFLDRGTCSREPQSILNLFPGGFCCLCTTQSVFNVCQWGVALGSEARLTLRCSGGETH